MRTILAITFLNIVLLGTSILAIDGDSQPQARLRINNGCQLSSACFAV